MTTVTITLDFDETPSDADILAYVEELIDDGSLHTVITERSADNEA